MEKLSLWQLSQKEMELAQALEDGGGELTPELDAAMTALSVSERDKLDAYQHVMLVADAGIAAAKAERDRLAARVRVLDNAKKRLKENLKEFMLATGVQRMEGTTCTAYLRNNPESLECDDDEILKMFEARRRRVEKQLPDYIKVTFAIDRPALKRAVVDGTPVKAHLVRTQSVVIK